MADLTVELAFRAQNTIGESPFWCSAETALYWLDIKAPALFRLSPSSDRCERWDLASEVGAFAIEDGGTALVALRHGLFRLSLDDRSIRRLALPPFDPTLFRFNEGKFDRTGRFWIGVMQDPEPETREGRQKSSLHVWTDANGLHSAPDTSDLHNGMAWMDDEARLLLSHSNEGVIWDYSYDARSGRLGERRRFADIAISDGIPDGAAIDAEGGYWCAIHGGWRLRRFHPDGTHDLDVQLPVSQPTAPCFGDGDLRTLYVTSALNKLDAEARRREPLAGSVFRLRTRIAGRSVDTLRRARR